MTDLRLESWTFPAADLGGPNPLPPFRPPADPPRPHRFAPDVPEADRAGFNYPKWPAGLPYPVQDGYDRARRPRPFRVAVLENAVLRAAFLLELGGRLWSLVHKPSGRELLYVNPVFQPGNLALRNAWFSGGVEWNMALIGHSPFTCAPVFAARLEDPEVGPVLRLYEWERVSGVPWQLDAFLPPESSFLFVRPRLANPHPREIPMYWWSNMAVPERPEVRVLVPAERELGFSYDASGEIRVLPIHGPGPDLTCPARAPCAKDHFYCIPEGERPWIAALDQAGTGLVQASTARLRGRKLFVWGQHPGGARWQEFLSVPGRPYFEIQAGLGRTQAQTLPMPAGAVWEWVEAYGLMEAGAVPVHGPDWTAAVRGVRDVLDRRLPRPALESLLARTCALAQRPPADLLQRGSGWGALERRRRETDGLPPLSGPGLAFDDESLGPDQAPWIELLERGVLPAAAGDRPGAWLVQPEWRERLRDSVARPGGGHALAWLHLGVAHYHLGDASAAEAAWRRSLDLAPSAWAWRNLAVLLRDRGDTGAALDAWSRACRLAPQVRALQAEAGQALLAAGRGREWLDWVRAAPAPVQEHGRIRFLLAQAALEEGRLGEAEAILSDLVVPDLREGEKSLTEVWFRLAELRAAAAEGRPVDDELRRRVRDQLRPPAHLDFRMAGS